MKTSDNEELFWCPEDEYLEGMSPGIVRGCVENSAVEDYYEWLLDMVTYIVEPNGRVAPNGEFYKTLLRLLWRREFYWIIPNDETRGNWGIELRERFLLECDPCYKPNNKLWTAADRIAEINLVPQRPCSVLEMMIALAERMAYQEYDGEHDIRDITCHIFWDLINNLGMMGYIDVETREHRIIEIHKKIDKMLDRTYTASGKGGLFPLKRPKSDQRTIEIWYQMQNWLSEKRVGDIKT